MRATNRVIFGILFLLLNGCLPSGQPLPENSSDYVDPKIPGAIVTPPPVSPEPPPPTQTNSGPSNGLPGWSLNCRTVTKSYKNANACRVDAKVIAAGSVLFSRTEGCVTLPIVRVNGESEYNLVNAAGYAVPIGTLFHLEVDENRDGSFESMYSAETKCDSQHRLQPPYDSERAFQVTANRLQNDVSGCNLAISPASDLPSIKFNFEGSCPEGRFFKTNASAQINPLGALGINFGFRTHPSWSNLILSTRRSDSDAWIDQWQIKWSE